jgi:hypothetical protein
VAIAHILAGSAQRNTLKHGDSVLNNGSLADDDAGTVINHDSRAKLRSRVYVDAEDEVHSTLQK